ncbi:MAG: cyclodeaminase/cyclohydrolase family protein [Firmicutes bacterium]|nr:cyclodeaminase/cyclohydrolase family protein [Bacillota bacterium]
MSYIKESCEDFVRVLASSEPTPGGGGASALVGALGAALGNMVGSLTTGKKKYREVEEEIQSLMAEAAELQKELLDLVQKDAESFAPLAAAYKMPKETKEEQAAKVRVMEAALRQACSVPFEIMEKCARGIDLCGEFAEKGSVMAVSDAGAGANLCWAALQSASLNIYINTKAMADREYAEQENARADRMLEEYGQKAERISKKVMAAIR